MGLQAAEGRLLSRPECPVASNCVRGEAKMIAWILKIGRSSEPGVVQIRNVSCQDMKGSIPISFLNLGTGKLPKNNVTGMLKGYKKRFK